MRFIRGLSQENIKMLKRIYKPSKYHQVRQRAQGIKLSYEGYKINDLMQVSPQLNLIEILWRFIKYKWLEVDAYSSWESLVEAVENIFRNYGDKYIINFA